MRPGGGDVDVDVDVVDVVEVVEVEASIRTTFGCWRWKEKRMAEVVV